MQFSSGVFLFLFLPITMIVYKVVGGGYRRHHKNMVLLLASLLFYSWGEPLFIFVLLLGIIANYFFGIFMEMAGNKKRYILIVSIVLNIGVFFVFKYLSFVTREISRVMPISVVNIALPIGISFYTFQIMSYIFDVYRGEVKAQRNIFSLALYISMFPQLVAGPIVRYSDIEYEINNRTETWDDFLIGTYRFQVGLIKKVLIADFLGGIADKIFTTAQYSELPMLTAWIGAITYTFEIYYDFSAYSDMAIGLGKCFGFHFKENFNYPYISCSITEFWKRWHISLTDWFRDYVYIPLGGNRVSPKRHIINLFLVWLLTGIWHGAEWTFIIWGLYYFVIQLVEKKTKYIYKLPKFLGYIVTMVIVTIGWVIFKAPSMECAFTYILSMFGLGSGIIDENSILLLNSSVRILIISLIGIFPINQYLTKVLTNNKIKWICAFLTVVLVMGLFTLSLLVVISGSYSPFIYFNF